MGQGSQVYSTLALPPRVFICNQCAPNPLSRLIQVKKSDAMRHRFYVN